MAGLKPDAVVVVATVRALKNHGGVAKADLNEENLEALEKGLPNLLQHVDNMTNVYRLPCVVAINAFPTDTPAELELVENKCRELGVNVALSEVWAKGGEGGKALADEVVRLCDEGDAEGRNSRSSSPTRRPPSGREDRRHREEGLPRRRRGANRRRQEEARSTGAGLRRLPVCMAKTQYTFSDDAAKLGAPTRLHGDGAQGEGLRRRRLRGGAHGRHHDHARPAQEPAAEQDRRGRDGKISGLF